MNKWPWDAPGDVGVEVVIEAPHDTGPTMADIITLEGAMSVLVKDGLEDKAVEDVADSEDDETDFGLLGLPQPLTLESSFRLVTKEDAAPKPEPPRPRKAEVETTASVKVGLGPVEIGVTAGEGRRPEAEVTVSVSATDLLIAANHALLISSQN
jgi:hypothetical protein